MTSAPASVPSVFSLPNELLIAIAAAGQEGRVPNFQAAFKSERTLSQVSQHFRNVIVGAPALWSLVEADLDVEGSMEIANIYLERSRKCCIWVSLKHFFADVDLNLIAVRLGQITVHIHRIWRLKIVLGSHSWNLVTPAFLGFSPRSPPPHWSTPLTHLEFRRSSYSDDLDVDDLFVALTVQCTSLVYLYLDLAHMPLHQHRLRIPSLKSLHLSVSKDEDTRHLLDVMDLFDTPAVTNLTLSDTHGDQIFELFNATSLPHASFLAVTTLTFVTNSCTCEKGTLDPFTQTIPSLPLRLFPALSSLSLINQCFTSLLVDAISGATSQPSRLLRTVTLCPDRDLEDVHLALRHAKQRGQIFPRLRLSSKLASRVQDWEATDATVEMFDPTELLDFLK
ncbi:hypothetical protein C8F04DRAFT_51976 [Mycena alexandri]|uniref:F-box domain-containing protein n=1 Tax=Mycena alexandri TaxID=1745969 RepID=A0AAD6WZ00_9AGAR|nr:hypothetical protein C8F04DRAFT_51976 [Mycena alexandri]